MAAEEPGELLVRGGVGKVGDEQLTRHRDTQGRENY
jgi:hypothetical protein